MFKNRNTNTGSGSRTRTNRNTSRPGQSGQSRQSGRRPTRGARHAGRGGARTNQNATPSTTRRIPFKASRGAGGPRHNNRKRIPMKKKQEIPALEKGVIRVIPLGGVEQVGQNMTAIEIGDDIIIIDAGFQFKDELTPGIDYILPNTRYLEERKDKIRALFITHGHLDHIGGIPYIIDTIGNPPIYTRQFGAIMVKKRHEEFSHLPKPDIKVIDGDETVKVGEIKVKTFPISHTIPDSMGLRIQTPYGEIVFVEDVRVDNIEGVPTEEEVEQYKQFKGSDALMLTMDSTSVEKPGWSLSESVVVDNIEKIIKDVGGRLIIGTFASQVERILAIIKLAEKYGKKVVVEGRSMKSNVEIMKMLDLVENKDVLVPLAEMDSLPPDKVVMIVTGAQGEEFAALMRMSNNTHKYVKLRKEDTILLSSSIIPGNHNSVVRLKDNLYRSEARIITYLDSDVHASGHGNREELKWIHEQVNYRFFMPVHGNHYMLRQHAELSESLGTPRENIVVPDNGSIIEIYDEGKKIRKLDVRAPHEQITVDGTAVGDIQDVVIEDRQLLSEAGIFVVVASINTKTKKLKKSPDIISRGFVYLRESQDLLRDVRQRVKRTVERKAQNMRPIDFDVLKKAMNDDLNKYLLTQTGKKPLVIPVLLGV